MRAAARGRQQNLSALAGGALGAGQRVRLSWRRRHVSDRGRRDGRRIIKARSHGLAVAATPSALASRSSGCAAWAVGAARRSRHHHDDRQGRGQARRRSSGRPTRTRVRETLEADRLHHPPQGRGTSQEMFELMHANGGGGGGQTTSSRRRATQPSPDLRQTSSRSTSADPAGRILPVFKSRRTTRSTASTTGSPPVGTEHVLQHEEGEPAPTSWSLIYSSKFKGKLTVPNNPIQIADAALYLMQTKPASGSRTPMS